MQFAEQIREIRKTHQLTQEQLASKLNVSRQTISSWENNRNLPDLEMVVFIAKTFDLSLDVLILGGSEMKDKLIQDGKETKKARFNTITTAIGGGLMALAIVLFITKEVLGDSIDDQGILHEKFYLIPIGLLLFFLGALIVGVMLTKNFRAKHQKNA
ncbi:Transcriptional regulator, XRE family [Clostridiaceae bacterium JG1575]|nr:Transcriptional regulator, XRE family [Clostridiaceae bacterium JG1575]